LFENVFAAPLERRKQLWLEQLALVVEEVQKWVDELTPETLAANEAFVTVAMHATQIAVRNHQQAKLEALRNAVLNSALPNPPQDDEQISPNSCTGDGVSVSFESCVSKGFTIGEVKQYRAELRRYMHANFDITLTFSTPAAVLRQVPVYPDQRAEPRCGPDYSHAHWLERGSARHGKRRMGLVGIGARHPEYWHPRLCFSYC
jgi:hypothetical protein